MPTFPRFPKVEALSIEWNLTHAGPTANQSVPMLEPLLPVDFQDFGAELGLEVI